MKKRLFIALTMLALVGFVSHELFARGGRGGGGGGGRVAARGGGGGGAAMRGGGGGAALRGGGGISAARPSINRTPAASRPSIPSSVSRPSINRPSTGGLSGAGSRPPLSTNRPATGGRPSLGNQGLGNTRPATRPNLPSTGNRPNPGNRPNVGAGGRPAGGGLAGGAGRPSAGDLDRFLNLDSRPGAGPAQRPSTRPGLSAGAAAGGALAGGAAAAFLQDRDFQNRPDIAGRPGSGERPERPTTLPAGPGDGTRPGRPGGGLVDRTGRPGTGDRPGDGIVDRPGRPGDRPGRPGIDNRPGRPGGGDFANHRPDRHPDRNRWNSWRNSNFTQINNYWSSTWNVHRNWYGGNWWNRYPHSHFHYYRPGFNCWGWATWGAVTNWFPWGWNQPVYYNYGDNVYYQGETVYLNGQPLASADEYAQQAEQIATSIPPDAAPADDSWMPLGVFALTADGQPTGVEPTMYLQLAVSKEGILAGTFQNTTTDTVQSVEGMVDKDSQRAAWTIVDQTRPLMETGISNLTEDTAPALVHFADGSTQQWLLVRLKEPSGA